MTFLCSKLTQLRCEVNARIEEANRSPTQSSINEEASKEGEEEVCSLKGEETERSSNCTETGSGVSGSHQTEEAISESELFATRVALELLEKVRTSTDLSHEHVQVSDSCSHGHSCRVNCRLECSVP